MEQESQVLPSAPKQALIFQWLRARLWVNSARILLQSSSLRLFMVLFFCILIWGGVYAGAAEGFHVFNQRNISLGGAVTGIIFDGLFVFLTVLLIFSTGIILYGSLFSSQETAFLLSTPAHPDQVFAYKFQGAIVYSSFGFVLLGSPVLVAYGVAFGSLGAPWYYYFLLLLFLFGFVLLAGSIGALLCFVIVALLPQRRKQVLILAIVAVVLAAGFWLDRLRPRTFTGTISRDFIDKLQQQFALAQGPLSPNHWMTRGIQASARGDLPRASYYLALVWSNGLFLYLLTAVTAARTYRWCYNRLATGGSLRRRYGGAWLDNSLSTIVGFLDNQTRLLIIKDFRGFRRDPSQWAQILIFMGLVVLYFTNVRRFYQEERNQPYQNGISLMNLAATATLMCAYTGRFIYPMLSLEGRKFWILGLLPLKRERLLWGKFAFSAMWGLLIAEFLVIFSDLMLGMPSILIGIHALTVAVLALGLSGLSVGIGAWIPNFKESDPSKIAVGFGGTLNLVTSLFFLILVIAVMAIPWHVRIMTNGLENAILSELFTWWLGIGALAGTALGAAAVFIPLRIGARALRRMEF